MITQKMWMIGLMIARPPPHSTSSHSSLICHIIMTHTGSYQTVIRWQFWLVITWSDTNAWHSCNYSLLNSSSMINMSSLSSFLITTRQDDLTYSYQYYLTIFNLWQQNKVIVVNGKSGKSWGAIIMNVVLICLIFKHVSTQLPSQHLISTFPPPHLPSHLHSPTTISTIVCTTHKLTLTMFKLRHQWHWWTCHSKMISQSKATSHYNVLWHVNLDFSITIQTLITSDTFMTRSTFRW